VAVFRGVAADRSYRIVVNGADVGTFGGKSLSAGILLPVPGPGRDGETVR
jgi:hypothetical protein